MVNAIRKATAADSDCLVASLVRAFDDDPILNQIIRQDHERAQAFDRYIRAVLCTLCLPHGEVFTTDDCIGGALWVPPGKSDVGLSQLIAMLPPMIRAAGLPRLMRLINFAIMLESSLPHEPHYHLHFIGVDPEHQGKGLGSALMQPILERCDREGCGAYLESSKETNLGFYQRNGFAVTGEIHLESEAFPLWLMWRDPQ